jgi:hypothetical protein
MKALLFVLALAAAEGADMARRLEEVARVASVMVDGDLAKRIVTERALSYLLKQDPRDPYLASDNYDVNHEAFIQTKKTLMRLARLVDFPCDVNLWMPIPTDPPRIHIVIRNVNEFSRFWTWGALHQEMFPEMRRVLETGKPLRVDDRPGWIAVLAPVYDGLGDVVGLVEVVSRTQADPRENVK